MGEGVEGGSTCCRGILQQTLKKVNSVGLDLAAENLHMLMKARDRGTYSIEWVGFDLGELVFHVIRIHRSYLLFRGRSEDFDDFY